MDAPRLTVALTFDHDAISDSDPARRLAGEVLARRVRAAGRACRGSSSSSASGRSRRPGSCPATRSSPSRRHRGDPRRRPRARLPRLVPRGLRRARRSTSSGTSSTGRSRRSSGSPGAPTGCGAPYWALGDADARAGRGAGSRYDSSLMADDYRPYRVRQRRPALGRRRDARWGTEGAARRGAASTGRSTTGRYFEPGPGRTGCRAVAGPRDLDRASSATRHEHAPGGLLTVTMHPECIGRGHRMAMLEEFRRGERSPSTASSSSGSDRGHGQSLQAPAAQPLGRSPRPRRDEHGAAASDCASAGR